MKAILALCLALFLVAIHAAALPKKSLQLKLYKNSQKAVKHRYFMCYNLFFLTGFLDQEHMEISINDMFWHKATQL